MILIMVKDIYLFWISSFYFVHQNKLMNVRGPVNSYVSYYLIYNFILIYYFLYATGFQK